MGMEIEGQSGRDLPKATEQVSGSARTRTQGCVTLKVPSIWPPEWTQQGYILSLEGDREGKGCWLWASTIRLQFLGHPQGLRDQAD